MHVARLPSLESQPGHTQFLFSIKKRRKDEIRLGLVSDSVLTHVVVVEKTPRALGTSSQQSPPAVQRVPAHGPTSTIDSGLLDAVICSM